MVIPEHLVIKHQILSLVEGGYCSLAEAAKKLDLSYRQTRRWWRRYQQTASSLIDFGRVRPRGGGWNKTEPSTANLIISLKQRWPSLSNPHISDLLEIDHNQSVSPTTVKRLLVKKGIYHPKSPKRRVHVRFEASAFGERLQMDTSSGAWMKGYRLIYLIAVMDEYSRMIVGWRWVDSDSTWNNMGVLHSVFNRFGLPKMLYTDNASMFKTIRHGKSIHQRHQREGYETEIQRAIRELGVTMFSHRPYQPQSKGKIERFFRFMQGRFISVHTAQNLDQLNAQFQPWISWYNNHHVNRTIQQKPKDRRAPSVWQPVSHKELDRALCFKLTRCVDKCNEFSFESHIYTIPKKHCLVHRKVALEYTPSVVRVYYHDREVCTLERKPRS